jgi:ATP adenylyltransferase
VTAEARVDRLWSPWRMQYIESAQATQEPLGCIFCEKPATGDDEGTYIVARAGRAYAILNAYPYNPGHLMIAPFRHVGDFADLGSDESADCDGLLKRSIEALREASGPDGFNVGMNLGRVAGAGIPGHVHWHVVPRWKGDTNFMSVVGETRVLPQLLAESYAKLKPLF